MNKLFSKEVLGHPLVLGAAGFVVVVALGSAIYYTLATRVPSAMPIGTATSTLEAITASGTVEPSENPDLAFQSGGRVVRIAVAVGDTVSRGETLASLDVASLVAQRAQASATLAAQQANLDQMQAGPRDVDVSAKQTAVAQVQLTLSNAYANISNAVNDAYTSSYSTLHTSTDTLFNNPNSTSPTLAFSTNNNQASVDILTERSSASSELATWKSELASLSPSASNGDLATMLGNALNHLDVLRDYTNAAFEALNGATPSGSFTQATVNADLASVGGLRDTVSGLITSIQSDQQQIAADALAVQSAQDALNQVLAGSTPQQIEAQTAQVEAAQASVDNYNAQLQNAIVVAPFAGTVASVHVKVGDIVSPNTIAISLNPESALQITAYVSEGDIANIHVGSAADVTLDAYGSDRHFTADVASVDTSPTMQNGIPAYKVVLQFAQNDPSISSGMTANITFAQ